MMPEITIRLNRLCFMLLLASLFSFTISIEAICQESPPLVIKGGGFVFYSKGDYTGYTLNAETERAFNHTYRFTRGLRIDYDWGKPKPEKMFPGIENLIFGYDFKFYPFKREASKTYQGVFLGLNPCYFYNINSKYKYGPGVGTILGYQYLLKDRFTLSSEFTMTYMQNINDNAVQTNSQDRYFYLFFNVKFGVLFMRK
jgi:hypothetical protein